jgi:hypothetical protein
LKPLNSYISAEILKLNFHERKKNAWEDSSSDDISGVIARFDGVDLQVYETLTQSLSIISIYETDNLVLSPSDG